MGPGRRWARMSRLLSVLSLLSRELSFEVDLSARRTGVPLSVLSLLSRELS